MFGHEKFGAYRYSIEFAALSAQIIEKLPQGYSKLIDQLRRAAIMDVLECMRMLDPNTAMQAKRLLEQVVAILSSVCNKSKKEAL